MMSGKLAEYNSLGVAIVATARNVNTMDESTKARMIFDFDKHLATISLACVGFDGRIVRESFSSNDNLENAGNVLLLRNMLVFFISSHAANTSRYVQHPHFKASIIFRFVSVIGFVGGTIFIIQVFQEQEELKAFSILYETKGYKECDNTVVIPIANKSPFYDATVRKMEFEISDPKELAKLEKIHPRPAPGNTPCGIYDRDGYFYAGCWRGDKYIFISKRVFVIPKGETEQLRLRIANRYYGDNWLVGTLELHYDSPKSPFKLENLGIKASPSFDTTPSPRTDGGNK